MSTELERLVADDQATWESPVVDIATFGTRDPAVITARIDAFCRAELGSGVRGARFYRVSVGCVAGLDLADGRSVVVKAQRGGKGRAYLEACFEVRRHLADAGFPCPRPLGGPTPLGESWLTADTLEDAGERGDAHDPVVRRMVAGSLAELVERARSFADHPALSGAWFTAIPEGRTFPRPHSPLFDFEGTREGAEWIEDLAARARARRRAARGERVVGHFDWRVEHLRFAEGRVVASYDWDSLHAELETVLVGATAHAFTADWQREDLVRVPSVDEIRAFVADYEAARGRAFDAAERATVFASCVYSIAYTARCNHALSMRGGEESSTSGGSAPRDPPSNGDFRPLLRAHGEELLEG